jgi:hypothetical protein
MNNVISINNRKSNGNFLGDYRYARNSERIPDEAIFFAGIIMAKVLPELFYSVYGGIIPLTAFVGTAAAGTICGLLMYYQFPFRIISCVDTGTVPQTPQSESSPLKKAA